ncbi:MAG: exosortase/archaeosortase family protein [Candidatus Pacearchaeota archaeon]
MGRGNIVRFSILFIFILYLIITWQFEFYPIPKITTYTVSLIANFINIPTYIYNNLLIVDLGGLKKIFNISSECSGVVLFIIFIFSTFLIPGYKLKHRIISLLFIPFLLIANSLRILMSVVIAKYYGVGLSLFFHDTIGQVFIFGVGITSYLVWLKITGNFPINLSRSF